MKTGIVSMAALLCTMSAVQAEEKQVIDTVASSLKAQGLMTPKGRFEIEPTFSYSQNSVNRISILGYTQLPALVVGIIEAEDADFTTFTWAVAARYGLTERIELELRAPWVYRHDSITKRNQDDGVQNPTKHTSSGGGLGDVEAAIRYQFNLHSSPYWIGGLRVKSATGKSPFEQELDKYNIYKSPPTGSGVWSFEPSLTMIYPLAPAVLFATASYTHNLGTDAQFRFDPLGDPNKQGGSYSVDLGDSFSMGMGMGFAVNDRLSFSLGFNHRTIFESAIGGIKSGEVYQLDSLTTGFSLAISESTSLNMSLQAGLTEDAPDVQLNFGMPMQF